MGHELGSATDIDRLLVFRIVYTNFRLDRERQFLELSYRFVGQKRRQKKGNFEFSWMSAQNGYGKSSC